jgi:hypothetical protein
MGSFKVGHGGKHGLGCEVRVGELPCYQHDVGDTCCGIEEARLGDSDHEGDEVSVGVTWDAVHSELMLVGEQIAYYEERAECVGADRERVSCPTRTSHHVLVEVRRTGKVEVVDDGCNFGQPAQQQKTNRKERVLLKD